MVQRIELGGERSEKTRTVGGLNLDDIIREANE
jgi:hypothetical protein